MTANHEIIFAERPVGTPTPAVFDHHEAPMPTPAAGQVLLRTIWLSVDPYLRGRMSDAKSYAVPFEVGQPIYSGCVAEVMESNGGAFAKGDVVVGIMNWAEWQTHSGAGLVKIDPGMGKLSYPLGVLGMPGMTAWAGLNLHGRPKEGETIVVSAATGAVGSLVAQLAKRKGLHVVGVAGGAEKCAWAVEELGCDACVDHRSPDLAKELAAACPNGVDIYFENVGGATLDAVYPLMNDFGRIPVCGMISIYNATDLPSGPDRSPMVWRAILTKRLSIRGFIVTDHWDQFPEFLSEVAPLVISGQVKARESVSEGLANAPAAFMALLDGGNFGKQVVRVGADPA